MASRSASNIASPGESPPGTTRPGGRTAHTREAVAAAALALLRRGETALSPALVAAEAGVARSTVYRRWPARSDLLREAQAMHTRSLHVPDTGDFERDVHQLSLRLARFFSDPTEVAINVALATHTDPEFNDWQTEAWNESLSEISGPFERAIERGDLSSEVEPASLIEMLISPMIVRTVVLRERIRPGDARRLADQVVRFARA